jgi:hypothetical protein
MNLTQAHRFPITDMDGHDRWLEVSVGDVISTDGLPAPDLLVISCFRDGYMPLRYTVVGMLPLA